MKIKKLSKTNKMAMLVLKPEQTGLPFEVFVSEKEYAAKEHHRPRLNVADRQNKVDASVAIDDPIQILAGTSITGKNWQQLQQWIQTNQQLLLQLWEEQIDQGAFGQQQRKLIVH